MIKDYTGTTIVMESGRSITVLGKEQHLGICERTGQQLWSVHGLRSWTDNGSCVPTDVLETLIAGAKSVRVLVVEE